MSFGIYPWLFLIPPLLVGGVAVFMVFFKRSELGRRRARYIHDKYGIVTGDAAPPEPTQKPDAPVDVQKNVTPTPAGSDPDAHRPASPSPESTDPV